VIEIICRSGRVCENNVQMYDKETEKEGVGRIRMAHDRVHWSAIVNKKIRLAKGIIKISDSYFIEHQHKLGHLPSMNESGKIRQHHKFQFN
jgi:hypothetical protein